MEHEPWLNLFMLAMLCPLITGAPSSNLCSEENLRISGGSFSFSKDGSLVRYSCSEGYYPTVKIRRCNKGGWNPMPKRKPPECKKITCPDPRGFENGEVYPYLPRYFVNDTTHYSCHSGYTFRGSGVRVCQLNGKWSGSTPVCGRNSDHCPDPGTPAGSTRTGHIFNIDDKVIYRCDKTLTLIGSKERVCQDDGQWSGTEPECYADFTYDTPEEASEAFSSSLKSNLAVSQQDEGTDQYGKKIHVDKGGKLDIYIALDVSDSIEEDDFEKAKDVIKTLIDKISYYEVSPNYEILIFATDVYRIVSMRDFKSGQGNNLEQILKRLANYKYESKGDRSGTNIAQAYKNILESMQIEQITNKEDFLETQHIVIMFSDGQANMGGNPKVHVDNIKNLVINDPSREDKLELYVFGMGDDVNAEDINDLKTDRGNEKFFFKLQSIEKLQETFDNMIDEGTSVALCGLYRDYDDSYSSHERRQYPWLAKISVTRSDGTISNCMGSLVTSTFILTAAHCFKFGDTPERITVDIGSNIRRIKVKQYIPHPRYNLRAKKHMGIPEYYEFDVALIQLVEPLIMGVDLRPICIPCTKETSGALRLSDREGTCRKHQEVLMSAETVNAAFISERKKKIEKKFIKIKQGKWRDSCIEDAKKAEGITATNAEDIVTDNFLCSGGTEPNRDDIACKGDSGGATFVVPGNRMVQVGIISWGVKDLCARNPNAMSEPQSRDYHTSLFSAEVRSFLKDYVGDGTLGTPLTFL
ncbi:complement factor b, like isoform X1 [Ctenopharyngodon idella]|uniref:complement factor b, like isoform X1 n=1 Tax=Ctenopharyngodon idella TaxID=7959 RepID=UPI0022313C3A|nr:complement factor b, like isoform X1 [Ctenopharyngodon idella]